MKKLLLIVLRSFSFVLIYSFVLADDTHIKIEKIDPSSDFPRIKVFFHLVPGPKSPSFEEKNFSLYQDGDLVKEPISIAEQTAEDRSYMVIAIDSSRSISKKFMSEIKLAALKIAKQRGPKDKIAVSHFDDRVVSLKDFGDNERPIIRSIESIKRHGKKTLLYNAINEAAGSFDKNMQNKRIVVLTDGKDEGSSIAIEDVVQSAKSAGVSIYFICDKITKQSKALEKIAMPTHGKIAYYANSVQMEELFKEFREAKKRAFMAAYKTDLVPDGKTHTIEVVLKQEEIRDKDSFVMNLSAQPREWSLYTLDRFIMAGIMFLLCVALLCVIIIFLYREKKLLKDKYGIEKALLEESLKHAASAGTLGQTPFRDQGAAVRGAPEQPLSRAWLFRKEAQGRGKRFLINIPEITIGSSKDNSVVINDNSVSDFHAKIKYFDGAFHLYDLISGTGTYLNGNKLLRPKQLHDWDEIRLGEAVLIFRDV